MHYEEYIKSELLTLIPVMVFVGRGLKQSKLPDKWIPSILGAISVFLCSAWVLATAPITGITEIAYALFISVTQGILVAGCSVYAHQIYIQSKKEE